MITYCSSTPRACYKLICSRFAKFALKITSKEANDNTDGRPAPRQCEMTTDYKSGLWGLWKWVVGVETPAGKTVRKLEEKN